MKEQCKNSPFHRVFGCVKFYSPYITLFSYSVDWSKMLPKLIVSGGADNAIRVFQYDSESNSVTSVCVVPGAHSADVNCVRWNPKVSGVLASCGDDGVVRLWTLVVE